jgi:hypothetical protein
MSQSGPILPPSSPGSLPVQHCKEDNIEAERALSWKEKQARTGKSEISCNGKSEKGEKYVGKRRVIG